MLNYMQQQAAAMAQQQGVFPPRMPAQFASPLQIHEQQHQQQHPVHQQTSSIPGQMNFRPGGSSDGMNPMQTETPHGGGGGGGPPASVSLSDARGGNKQDGTEAGSTGDGQGNSAVGSEEGK